MSRLRMLFVTLGVLLALSRTASVAQTATKEIVQAGKARRACQMMVLKILSGEDRKTFPGSADEVTVMSSSYRDLDAHQRRLVETILTRPKDTYKVPLGAEVRLSKNRRRYESSAYVGAHYVRSSVTVRTGGGESEIPWEIILWISNTRTSEGFKPSRVHSVDMGGYRVEAANRVDLHGAVIREAWWVPACIRLGNTVFILPEGARLATKEGPIDLPVRASRKTTRW